MTTAASPATPPATDGGERTRIRGVSPACLPTKPSNVVPRPPPLGNREVICPLAQLFRQDTDAPEELLWKVLEAFHPMRKPMVL